MLIQYLLTISIEFDLLYSFAIRMFLPTNDETALVMFGDVYYYLNLHQYRNACFLAVTAFRINSNWFLYDFYFCTQQNSEWMERSNYEFESNPILQLHPKHWDRLLRKQKSIILVAFGLHLVSLFVIQILTMKEKHCLDIIIVVWSLVNSITVSLNTYISGILFAMFYLLNSMVFTFMEQIKVDEKRVYLSYMFINSRRKSSQSESALAMLHSYFRLLVLIFQFNHYLVRLYICMSSSLVGVLFGGYYIVFYNNVQATAVRIFVCTFCVNVLVFFVYINKACGRVHMDGIRMENRIYFRCCISKMRKDYLELEQTRQMVLKYFSTAVGCPVGPAIMNTPINLKMLITVFLFFELFNIVVFFVFSTNRPSLCSSHSLQSF